MGKGKIDSQTFFEKIESQLSLFCCFTKALKLSWRVKVKDVLIIVIAKKRIQLLYTDAVASRSNIIRLLFLSLIGIVNLTLKVRLCFYGSFRLLGSRFLGSELFGDSSLRVGLGWLAEDFSLSS